MIKIYLIATLFAPDGAYIAHHAVEYNSVEECVQKLPANLIVKVKQGEVQFRCVLIEFSEQKKAGKSF